MAIVQYAIDVLEEDRALWLGDQAVNNGVRCLEAGHVLIKAVGIQIIPKFKKLHPDCHVVADMKTMDMGGGEVELAASYGADIVMVCGAASDGVIESAVTTASKTGVRITSSLMGIRDQYARAKQIDSMGVNYILAHRGYDDTFNWTDAENVKVLDRMVTNIRTPLAIGGAINEENYPMLNNMGFAIIISGRGITNSDDPGNAARKLVDLSNNYKAPQL